MNFVVRDAAESSLQALFQSSGVDGVRARTQLFERAVEGLTSLISRLRAPDAEVLRFPPVTNRSHIEKSGYLGTASRICSAPCAACMAGRARSGPQSAAPARRSGWRRRRRPTWCSRLPPAIRSIR